MSLFFDKILLDGLSECLQLSEAVMLGHVILEMAAQVHLKQVAQVRNVIAGPSRHLREPCVQLVQPVHTNHVVDVAKLLEVLAQRVHRLGQVSTFLLYLARRFNDLLVENLVAVSEVSHASTEYHCILVHVHSNTPLFSDQFNNRLAILGLLE